MIGVRQKGDDKFYNPDHDILACTPSILIKGAVFAADPKSWIAGWLKGKVDNPGEAIRQCLKYMLGVLEECRSNQLDEVFDANSVNEYVFQAVMMGCGAMLLRKFNRLFRENRFTSVQTGSVVEPTQHVDIEAAMRAYDGWVAECHK